MLYYEVYLIRGQYEIWKFTNGGLHAERFKAYKTRKGAENWAAKQWHPVYWR